MPAGLTREGFKRKLLEDILADIEKLQRDDISQSLDQGAQSVLGQLNETYAEQLDELWEVLEAVYAAAYPDNAAGLQLDKVAAITGTTRQPATRSTVLAEVELDNGTTLPKGSVASVDGNPEARFRTTEAVTNDTGGTATFQLQMESEDTGPVQADKGDLTVIETVVAGWNNVNNPDEAATPGEREETDAELRQRRQARLGASGTSTVAAIRAALLAFDEMRSAVVFENDTDDTVRGIPPHSLEAVVWDGTDGVEPNVADNDIAQRLWDTKSPGVGLHGRTSGTATDETGTDHTVKFTRAALREVHLEIFLTKDPDLYGDNGDEKVKDAIVAWSREAGTRGYDVGEDVILSRLHRPLLNDVPGVVDVTEMRAAIGGAPTASDTNNLRIGPRSVAVLQQGRITVHSSDVSSGVL